MLVPHRSHRDPYPHRASLPPIQHHNIQRLDHLPHPHPHPLLPPSPLLNRFSLQSQSQLLPLPHLQPLPLLHFLPSSESHPPSLSTQIPTPCQTQARIRKSFHARRPDVEENHPEGVGFLPLRVVFPPPRLMARELQHDANESVVRDNHPLPSLLVRVELVTPPILPLPPPPPLLDLAAQARSRPLLHVHPDLLDIAPSRPPRPILARARALVRARPPLRPPPLEDAN